MLNRTTIKQKALSLGFNIAGVIPAVPAATLDAYFRWIDADMHGKMGYLARPDRKIRRQNLEVILPGVKSMILVGLDYAKGGIPQDILTDASRGRIASYAWGIDYHDLMLSRLKLFANDIGQEIGHRVYVDTGAILERAHAQQAGLGFIGKNTMLIHPRKGSYFFLGEILLTKEFDDYDVPTKATMCGQCTRCLDACPTDAFPGPYVLDARRCISYLTIENKGWIPPDLRRLMGNWVYGCDICQEVCPWQRFYMPSNEVEFYPQNDVYDTVAPFLLDLLKIDSQIFQQRYHKSPIYRIKRERLVRNACIAAGNWGNETAIDPLIDLLSDESALVRGHAAWALKQIMLDDVNILLKKQLGIEQDKEVREEIINLL